MIESMIAAVDTAADSSARNGIVFLFVGLLLYYMPAILALAWTFTTPCTSSATIYILKPDGTLEAVQSSSSKKGASSNIPIE